MQHHRRNLSTPALFGGSAVGRHLPAYGWAAACGLLILLATAPPVHAQVFPGSGSLVVDEDFNTYSHSQNACWSDTPWELWMNDPFYDDPGDPCKGYAGFDAWPYISTSGFSSYIDNDDAWKPGMLAQWQYCPRESAMMVARQSKPDHPSYNPDDWTNVRLEMDIRIKQFTAAGFAWAMSMDPAVDALSPEQLKYPSDGYAFWIEPYEPPPNDGYPGFPLNDAQTSENRRGRWRLARINGMDRTSNVSGVYDWTRLTDPHMLVPMEDPSTWSTTSFYYTKGERVYTFQLDWYCGNMRVRYMIKWAPTPGVPTEYYGCSSALDADGICSEADRDNCWCTVTEVPMTGLDASPIAGPGMVGYYLSGSYSGFCSTTTSQPQYDNFKAYALPSDCGVVCGPWSGWNLARTDVIPFKYLYEGALLDFSAGRNLEPPDQNKININTWEPTYDSTYNHSLDHSGYCNGWNLLEDLPSPAGGTNVDDIAAWLEPMYSAVDYEPNGASFDWVPMYENDPASPDYDPVPVVADGSTPINSALLEAFDWYDSQVTGAGPWSSDPYEDCRKWFLVLITDGEEACEFEACSEGDPGCSYDAFAVVPGWYRPNPDAVCEADGAAKKFANPPSGAPPVPIYTIGFSDSVAEDSPLACIAEETGGLFLPARNASQLSDALYEVFYELEGRASSFVPYKVAPPPNSVGGSPTRDYLAVYPIFTAADDVTLWQGNLYAFPLNKETPDLDWTEDCALDTTGAAWDAESALAAQLDLHDEGTPQRHVYMSSDYSGDLLRYSLATIPTDVNLRADFKDMLDVTGGVTDIEAQQIVNFVRNIYMDNDADPSTPGPPADPRPGGYPLFGDFFHSQPLIVNPPNTSTYYYDYGFEGVGEEGAHNYALFMTKHAKRRRMVFVGNNDGMLHAFDGGVWDRNRGDEDETYDKIHDLGTGVELFGYVPQAVMNKLYDLTDGGTFNHQEPQWMVDGYVLKSDVFIDADGDTNREWRTVLFTTMRRGGRGVLALDITQPDPIGEAPDYKPEVHKFAGCRDVGYGDANSDCDGAWPQILWEFADETDEDPGLATSPGNCPAALSGDDCAPYWDLGWTWSRPTVARIAVYDGAGNPPDDTFVVFFGGGWDSTNNDQTGLHFYGVDIETGNIVFKYTDPVGTARYDMPGGATALDSNADGFHDRVYFTDSNGRVYRLQFPDPDDSAATGGGAGTVTTIFDFRTSFPDRQEFFTRPITVPTLFAGGTFTWAVALGSGDRAGLARTDSGIDHFYFLLDAGDTTTRDASDLVAVSYADLDGTFTCENTALSPSTGDYGWYLSLRDTEKVMYDATVIGGYVYFTTFDPSTQTASHNVPNQCGAEPETGEGSNPIELDVVCRASGIGRAYELWYECGMGDYSEHNDIISGNDTSDTGDGQDVYFPTVGGGEEKKVPDIPPAYNVTNWRQE